MSRGQSPSLILSPHFDDAVLSCWSVLRHEEGASVVNVFAGVPDADAPLSRWDRLTGGKSAAARARERAAEDADALARVGCRPVNLDFLPNTYRDREQDAGPVLSAIRPHLPDGVTVYAPAGIGRHPDHYSVRAVAIGLRSRGVAVTLYADLPYCCTYGWPHWVTGKEPDPYMDVTFDWEQPLAYGEVSVDPRSASIVDLAEAEQGEKLAAVKTYRTQYSGMAAVLAQEDALRYEAFWPLEAENPSRVQALSRELAWRAGVRRGSRLEIALRHPVLRRLRPSVQGRLARALHGRK